MSYAGSYSLARELKPVASPHGMRAGDALVDGGFPGHAVLVVDMAEDRKGGRAFLLAQSYMPAQDVHILDNPESPVGSPWYRPEMNLVA